MSSVVHIVDDDASVRAATSFLLRSYGYGTQIYSGGAEFLSSARLVGGCILLDLRMPEIDGFDVQTELARLDCDLPVILMTGHGDIPSTVRGLRLGAFDFIEKPFAENVLIRSVEQALASADLQRSVIGRRSKALARISLLSAREKQILRGLLAGMTNKEIARIFEISPRTVEMHRANMMRDMSCDTLSDVIRIGVEAELDPLPRGSEGAEPEALALRRVGG